MSATENRWTDPAWAWAPYAPDAGQLWDLRLAGHLYRRAAFGGTWDELQAALAAGPQATVQRLLHPPGDVAAFHRRMDAYEAGAIDPQSAASEGLVPWWLRRMLETPHPLQEKMLLFWRNHFAIRASRVANAQLMVAHLHRLREHALGRYDQMQAALLTDAALYLGLGGAANHQAQPNAAFARQLLESFWLGPEMFQESDVQAAARAFSGWFVVRHELQFRPREHDAGPKPFLGQRGAWVRDDVLRIALAQPAAAALVVRKLYRWLISEETPPEARLVEPLAAQFARDFDIARLVETMLRSNLFFSPAAYRQRVKSPLEYALGIVRGLEGLIPTQALGRDLTFVGQNLLEPPTLAGWEGGRTWINRFSLLGRGNLAAALLASEGEYNGRLNPLAAAEKHGLAGRGDVERFLVAVYLQGDLAASVQPTLAAGLSGEPAEKVRELAFRVVTLPEFQLA